MATWNETPRFLGVVALRWETEVRFRARSKTWAEVEL